MAYEHISRTTKIVIIVEFVLLAYMLYVLSTSLYKSYQVDRFIETATLENEKLAQENTELIEDYEYYRSEAYKEKIAKQNFGLIRPGEEVIVLVPGDPSSQLADGTEGVYAHTQKYYESLSNPKKWYLFFFDRERFSVGY
ncbi:hypothetical protein CO046_01905 [Candidatus Peregrinibacteria bacterium CG_4_9_14_0_2_um_filter_53_11]|nr:MAG: hypothetical protein CO046_01905 [Candidatus Peregrinibacteria bacterium CG_4_9_14_0_2_um_filter_53_11]